MKYFLDFEASSLNSGSFPIEIAWVDESGQGESYLIQPQWNWIEWSTTAQYVHGISRGQLRKEGLAASWVAERAWATLNGSVICSDNPAFDAYWLSMLLGVIGKEALPIVELIAVMGEEVKRVIGAIKVEESTAEWHQQAQNLLHQGKIYCSRQIEIEAMRVRIRHRALPDAQGMWWCWWKVQDWVEHRLAPDCNLR